MRPSGRPDGLTQEQWATRLNTPVRTVSRWESGENRPRGALARQIVKELVSMGLTDEAEEWLDGWRESWGKAGPNPSMPAPNGYEYRLVTVRAQDGGDLGQPGPQWRIKSVHEHRVHKQNGSSYPYELSIIWECRLRVF